MGSTLLRLIFIRRGRALLGRTAATTTAAGTSPPTTPTYTTTLSNRPHTPPLTITTTTPSNTATITTASATGSATLSLLPTGCFMDNQKANEVYDLAYSEEPIAPLVREALEAIDQALDDFE